MAVDGTSRPNDDDLRDDDHEYNPAVEPKSAKAWINLLEESEKAFESWNAHCDNLDKIYASLEKLGSADPEQSARLRLEPDASSSRSGPIAR